MSPDTVTPRLGDVVAALHARFPPDTAEDWDRVGLVCGDPAADVGRVLFAVDPAPEVVDEALRWGAGLLVTHHPLLLRGVHSVATTTSKGDRIHRLIRGGCGLLAMHTNADVAHPGVNDALVELLGLEHARPLRPIPDSDQDKWVVFTPPSAVAAVLDALFDAGAGRGPRYDRCAYDAPVSGRFRPLAGAQPNLGSHGKESTTQEERIEVLADRRTRERVRNALLSAHPYQDPAYEVVAVAPVPGSRGLGRVGTLAEPTTLSQFAERVAEALPATHHGVRVAGDPDREIRVVAVSGGSGDSLLADADRSGADVFLTSDLRHHPAEEHLAQGGCALVDVAHWAGEWPWLRGCAATLQTDLAERGFTVDTAVSQIPTDPWSMHVRSPM